MPDSLTQDQWLKRVLGVSVPRATPGPAAKQVRFATVPQQITRPTGGVQITQTRPRSGGRIQPPPVLRPDEFDLGGKKKIAVARKPGGGTVYTAPPPPVREITFSGGGAKGAALPGAIKALQDSGVLRDAKKIAGASVGSMTAALIAAGITAEEFTRIANDDATTDAITEGSGGTKLGLLGAALKNKFTGGTLNPLTGQGLEKVVGKVLDDTLRKRIHEYTMQCEKTGTKPDEGVAEVAEALAKRGPTFMDLRKLSKAIPAVKEVVITGTYTTELGTVDKASQKDFENQNDTGQLYVFDADSEPDLQVAVAVHASASFPAAFKPVDITLAIGLKVRFIDGGVMNNTPTSSSLGRERELDPIPEGRGMTFVFEDEGGASKDLLKGTVAPTQGLTARLQDWFVGSENAGAEYAKNRVVSDRPEEIVEVPLTIEPKAMKWYQRQKLKPWKRKVDPDADMRGGTLNFGLSMEAKLKYQDKTETATNDQIDRAGQPRTREFASDAQMFVSIPLAELQTLATGGFEGAAQALVFRERVATLLGILQQAVKTEFAKSDGQIARVLEDPGAASAIGEFDTLAGKDVDFQGYVAREINKREGLDNLFAAARKGGMKSDALTATYAVADAVKARNQAQNILKDLVYPKMKQEPEGGAGIETLRIVEGLLRGAQEIDDVNGALQIAIDHFLDKSDRRLPKRGHKAFAQQLQRRFIR
ncbi:MAG: patatin-like phospholipase family protein [Burkholderiaceae bacterium]|nr:patatin-like phospholipase family protein [Burkholderiaceae bacterium]